jgi:hypothetical protein
MELQTTVQTEQPVILKALAKIFSYLFHPLFIPSYIFFWLVFRFPFEFAGITPLAMFARKVNIIMFTAFFPAFAVFLLWRLKFIQNMFLRTQKERIVPYMITMIFYWWEWYLSRNFTDQPITLNFFYLGIFIACIISLIANNFFKISMHATATGGALMFVLLTCFVYRTYLGLDISIVTLLAGVVCTSRLLLKEHASGDVYIGFIVGIFSQILAVYFAL